MEKQIKYVDKQIAELEERRDNLNRAMAARRNTINELAAFLRGFKDTIAHFSRTGRSTRRIRAMREEPLQVYNEHIAMIKNLRRMYGEINEELFTVKGVRATLEK